VPSRSRTRDALALAAWLGISFVAAALGASASIRAADFYGRLARPGWAPPAAAFGPVWTVLYALMGVAAWMVWRTAEGAARRLALALFLVQLALNALWSWLFFAWHLGAASFADIVALWIAIAATMAAFGRARQLTAALLLVPYLLWVGFAAALNYEIWRMNPGILG
jgi:tryptophan-rich sensory protein